MFRSVVVGVIVLFCTMITSGWFRGLSHCLRRHLVVIKRINVNCLGGSRCQSRDRKIPSEISRIVFVGGALTDIVVARLARSSVSRSKADSSGVR